MVGRWVGEGELAETIVGIIAVAAAISLTVFDPVQPAVSVIVIGESGGGGG